MEIRNFAVASWEAPSFFPGMIGIDLGTTNSLVAVMKDGKPQVLANELDEALTPSVVAVTEDDKTLVGRAARDYLTIHHQAGQAFFKRDMGTDKRYTFGGRKWSPIECSAVVLSEMKRIAETQLGEGVVTSAVISVPAYFHDQQRQATLEAAEIAGLKVDRIINEPTAAALAYGYQNPDEEKRLLIFDIGGGTFDVTILEVFEGVIDVLASGGDSRLGGEDYTDAMLQMLCKNNGWVMSGNDRTRWRAEMEVVKRRLATEETAQFSMGRYQAEVTKEDLRQATTELTARLRPVVLRALRDAKLSPDQIDDVLLVGGASRMTLVTDLIHELLQRIPNQSLDPDRVVALGAAVQAALCQKDSSVDDIVLTDVCSHTLGVETTRQSRPGQFEPGFFEPLIDRNTTVPTSRAKTFFTLHPEQDEIRLKIYQGESRKTDDNHLLGELNFNDLKQKPGQKRPGEFEVRFSYDMNGVLEVEATIAETQRKIAKVFEQRPGMLSPEELEAAVKRLQPLKLHPRDEFANRARIERANRLFEELQGNAREQLTHHLDRFELAIEAQDPEQIKIARAHLDNFMRPFFKYEGELQPVDC